MFITWLPVAEVRVEEKFFFFRRCINESLPASLQRLRIRGDDPSAARHHAGTIIHEQVFQFRVGRPCAL